MTKWTDFVKKVASDKKITYKEALKVASPLFKKEKNKGSKKEEPKKEMKPKVDKKKQGVKMSAKDKPKQNKNNMKNKGGGNDEEQ